MKSRSDFLFYGIGVRVFAHDSISSIVERRLTKDLSYFRVNDGPSIHSRVHLLSTHMTPPFARGFHLFTARNYKVYGFNANRTVEYDDGTCVYADLSNGIREYWVCSPKSLLLYEVSYLLFQSLVGEALDKKGLYRVHALGLQYHDQTSLVILPSGCGKSALANLFLKETDAKIFSDESPLVRNRYVYPYPVRMALEKEVANALMIDFDPSRIFRRNQYKEKVLLDIPEDRVASPQRVTQLIYGKPGQISEIRKGLWYKLMVEMFKSMGLGLGTAQMAEFRIRINDSLQLSRILKQRTSALLDLIQVTPNYEFSYTKNALSNFKVLRKFFLSQETKKAPFPKSQVESI